MPNASPTNTQDRQHNDSENKKEIWLPIEPDYERELVDPAPVRWRAPKEPG